MNREMLQKNLDTIVSLGTAVGEWTSKYEARQTGVSLHLKFENKVDVNTTIQFVEVMQNCPAMLADAIRKLLVMTEEAA